MRLHSARLAILSLLLGSSAHAGGAPPSVWIEATDGIWSDPLRWTAGVPTASVDAIFGSEDSRVPFVVSIDAMQQMATLAVTNQRLELNAASVGWPTHLPAITIGGLLSVAPLSDGSGYQIEPALTLTHGRFTLGSVLVDSTAPAALAAKNAILTLTGGGIDPLLVVNGACQLDAASLSLVGAASASRLTFGSGQGSVSSLTLENESVLDANRRFRFGVHGAHCDAFVGSDSVISTTSGILLGGDLDGWTTAPGSASMVVDGGTLRLIGNGGTVAVATQGVGSMTLRGGARIEGGGSLYLAKYGGVGSMVVDGPALIEPKIGGAPVNGHGTLLVTGPEAVLTCTQTLVLVGDGSLHATARDGAQIVAPHVRLGGWDSSLSIEGPGSTIATTTCDFLSPAVDYRLNLRNGGLLDAKTLVLNDGCTLVSTIGAGGVGTADADSITLRGRFEVQIDCAKAPIAGAFVPILSAPSITGEFRSWSTPQAFGYPALLDRTESAVGIRWIDHIDGFTLKAPSALTAGFVESVVATVTIDGVDYEVTPTAAFTLSDPDVLAINSEGAITGLAEGVTILTARFGPHEASTKISVSLGGPVMPVELVSSSFEFPANSGSTPSLLRNAMSSDGRIVAWTSLASSLGADDRNGYADVYLRDLDTLSFERVSEGASGEESPFASANPILSRDGRFALAAVATQLTEIPVPPLTMLPYIRDRLLGSVELAVRAPDGSSPNKSLDTLAISDNGRWVLVQGSATNLIPGDTASFDSFLHDRWTRTTERVSIRPDGAPFTGSFGALDMSADGRFVVLIAWASEGGTFAWRLFLRDRLAGTTTRLLEEISADILCAAISADGAHLAFLADGLVLPELEAPAPWQAYVLDVETGSIIPASRGPSGWSMVSVDGISISDGGRYIAYGAGGDLADDAPEGSHQFYRFDRMTGEITRVSNGVSGPLTGLVSSFPATAISADGRTIAFRVMENGFAPSDDNGFSDIVVVRVDGLPGDLDADGDVDAIDLSILISRWGTHGAEGGGNADLDGDGEVGPIDLATLLAAWR